MRLGLLIVLCWLCLVGASELHAQATSPDLMEGILMFEKGKYRKAIQSLGELINSDTLSPQELPKAHYFLGQAYMGLVRTHPRFRKKNPLAVARGLYPQPYGSSFE